MKFLVLTSVFLVASYTVNALPRYLLIPLDEAGFIESSLGFSPEPTIVRVARRAETFVPATLGVIRTEEVEPTPRIERAAAHVLDYVDFGGHTGENGAFGWYADFPAQR